MCRTVPRAPRTRLAGLVVALTVAACPAVPGAASASLAPADSQALWRQVGIMDHPSSSCPTAPDWTVRHLFSRPGVPPSLLPPALRRFCLYVCEPDRSIPSHPCNTVDAADVAALQAALPAGMQLDPERMATVPLTGDLEADLAPDLAALFLQQTGKVPLPAPASSQVRLVVVDTAPEAAMRQLPLSSSHGPTLEQMARTLLCLGDAPCAAPNPSVVVSTGLALAYTGFDGTTLVDPDPERGGEAGFVSDLARAIHAAVELAEGGPLVINLSVGWSGALFGGLEAEVGDMPADVQAVYRALEHAHGAGALVVAATGNRPDLGAAGAEPGPWLPAAWERRPATGVPSSLYRPLVYGASAIDRHGDPVVNAQPGSAAPLAAYGDHGVVETAPGDYSTVLTGSSVAALVVSSAAAAAWSYAPSWSAGEVMDLVYAAGDAMPDGRAADVCLGDDPCADPDRFGVRRVSMCRSVAAVCDVVGCAPPFAGGQDPCAPWPAPPPVPSADLSWFAGEPQIDASSYVPAASSPCGPDQLFVPWGQSPPADPCPHRQYPGLAAQPWATPQPQSNPCSVCGLGGGTLYVQTSAMGGAVVSDPTLILCPGDPSPAVYPLAAGPLPATFSVTNVPTGGCASAMLAFEVTSNGTTSSSLVPLVVLP